MNCLEITGIPESFSAEEFREHFRHLGEIEFYILTGKGVIVEVANETEQRKILSELKTYKDIAGDDRPFVWIKDRPCTVQAAYADLLNPNENYSLSETKILVNNVPSTTSYEDINKLFEKYKISKIFLPPMTFQKYHKGFENVAYILATEACYKEIVKTKLVFQVGNCTCTVNPTNRIPALNNWAPYVDTSFRRTVYEYASASPPPPDLPLPKGEGWKPETKEKQKKRSEKAEERAGKKRHETEKKEGSKSMKRKSNSTPQNDHEEEWMQGRNLSSSRSPLSNAVGRQCASFSSSASASASSAEAEWNEGKEENSEEGGYEEDMVFPVNSGKDGQTDGGVSDGGVKRMEPNENDSDSDKDREDKDKNENENQLYQTTSNEILADLPKKREESEAGGDWKHVSEAISEVMLQAEGFHALFPFNHFSLRHPERYHDLNPGDFLEPVALGPEGWCYCKRNGGDDVLLSPVDYFGMYGMDSESKKLMRQW